MLARVRLLFGIAARHLSKRKRQTAVGIAGVGIGVGFFLATSALMVGSQNDFLKTFINAAPHIIVSDEIRTPRPQPAFLAFPGTIIEVRGYKTRNEVRGIKDWQQIARSAQAIPGAIVAPSLSGAVTLRVGGREAPLAIIGVDPEVEDRIANVQENLAAGSLHNLETTQGGVIIGEELAHKLGVGMGDTIGATSRAGTRSLKIVGLFAKGRGFFGASDGYVLLREAQSLTAQPFVINRIGISIPDPYQAQQVAGDLETRFGYKAQSWEERSADFQRALVIRSVITYAVVSAILLVASFGIYSVVSNSVTDKRRDIAILRSIGFSEGDLQRIFVIEGVVLAVTGVIAGWALGLLLMHLLGSIKYQMFGFEHLPLDRGIRQFLIAGGASLVSAGIAAWLPARKAARVDPVEILRGAA